TQTNSTHATLYNTPRHILVPSGRFAKAFREQWNGRFAEKVNILFDMSPDCRECYHVLIPLPHGDYYDGGNGVISGPALLEHYIPGTTLDEMLDFDFARLDKWSYSLKRTYPICPNYSDDTTLRLITHHLDRLSSTLSSERIQNRSPHSPQSGLRPLTSDFSIQSVESGRKFRSASPRNKPI